VVGHHPEGDERVVARLGEGEGRVERRGELLERLDEVVGREHRDHGLGVCRGDDRAPQGDGGQRVAPGRLDDQAVGLQPFDRRHRLAQLLPRAEPHLRRRHDRGGPLHRDVEQRAPLQQRDELLGQRGGRERPQPGAGPAGQDQGVPHADSRTSAERVGAAPSPTARTRAASR
jgi:hypothetical protein